MDTLVFGNSMSNFSSETEDNIFLSKQQQFIVDDNQRNYSRNEITWSSVTLSNNGSFCDYQNAFLSIPVVCRLTTSDALTADEAKARIRLKNNLALLDSISVQYNNTNVIQESAEMVGKLVFDQTTTLSKDDLTRSDVYGYVKDNSKWSYSADYGVVNSTSVSDQRSEVPYQDVNTDIVSEANMQSSGVDYHVMEDANNHYFFITCRIMLRDLDFFKKMPSLVKGANIRITARLNTGSMKVAVSAGGVKTVTNNVNGSCFPVMRIGPLLANDSDEEIEMKIASIGNYKHSQQEARLYVNVYQLAPSFETQYLAIGSKKILYTDMYVNHLRKVGTGNSSHLITNGLSRATRMIIMPLVSRDIAGVKMSQLDSPYCSSPCVVAPHNCFFNLKLSGRNLYTSPKQLKYETFLEELHGKYGVGAGLEKGQSSSLISMKDYNNTFGFVCFDLKHRHLEDYHTPVSYELMVSNMGAKELELLVYIEYEKDCIIDISTGQLLSA